MIKVSLLILMLVLSSCASHEHHNEIDGKKYNYPNVSKELRSYLGLFNKYYKRYHGKIVDNDIDMKFGKIKLKKDDGTISDKALGVYFRDKDITIINEDRWDNLSYVQRRALVFHELGHHVLRLKHDEDFEYFYDDCRASLMTKRMQHPYCLGRHWRHLVKNLFEDDNTFWFHEAHDVHVHTKNDKDEGHKEFIR